MSIEIQINKIGSVLISRKGNLTALRCKYKSTPCSHSCPSFSIEDRKDTTVLKLCDGIEFYCKTEKFKDLREISDIRVSQTIKG